jgi:hypothetical protein
VGIFDKLSRRKPSSEPAPAPPAESSESSESSEEPPALAELRDQVVLWVLPGFNTRDEVLELEHLVDDVWQTRLAEQQTWTGQTDADKVAAAFADLDAAGVIARMNFTCCQNCGATEIYDERPTDRPSTGYVFFHQQDTERLADTPAHLFLAYGPLDPTPGDFDAQATEIGRQIETVLRAHNLPVTWTGSTTQRISVGPLTWHRRLPS